MLVVGLILVVLALVMIGFMLFGDTSVTGVDVDLGVVTLDLTPLEIFGLGAAVVFVLTLGLWLTTAGLRRQRAKRKELKELRHIADARGTQPDTARRDGTRTDTARHDTARHDDARSRRDVAPVVDDTRDRPVADRPRRGEQPPAAPVREERPTGRPAASDELSPGDRALMDRELNPPPDTGPGHAVPPRRPDDGGPVR